MPKRNLGQHATLGEDHLHHIICRLLVIVCIRKYYVWALLRSTTSYLQVLSLETFHWRPLPSTVLDPALRTPFLDITRYES